MKKALTALDGDRSAAEKVVDTLVKERYIDELRYASAFARDKSSLSGWGGKKIRYMLAAKGVPGDIVDAAMEEIDSPKARTRLEKLLENKLKGLKDDPQCRMKMLRFGLGRGYGYEEVSEVLNVLMKR